MDLLWDSYYDNLMSMNYYQLSIEKYSQFIETIIINIKIHEKKKIVNIVLKTHIPINLKICRRVKVRLVKFIVHPVT